MPTIAPSPDPEVEIRATDDAPSTGLGGDATASTAVPEVHDALLSVMRSVVTALPDGTTLGDIVHGARSNEQMAPLLEHMSVQELIDIAISRPVAVNGAPMPEPELDEDGNPLMDLPEGTGIVRRRADVPDGDLMVLRHLSQAGPLAESAIARGTKLTSEQVRLILRHLRSQGQVHVEGSGAKRRIKVTRSGAAHLRRHGR